MSNEHRKRTLRIEIEVGEEHCRVSDKVRCDLFTAEHKPYVGMDPRDCRFSCRIFGSLSSDKRGYPIRHPECIECEVKE